MPAVRPEFGPTLPELLGPRLRVLPRAARLGLGVAAAVVVLVAVWAVTLRGGDDAQRTVVVREPVAFNFIFRAPFHRLALTDGALARVGSGEQSFAVRAVHLPAYRGDAAGFLPMHFSHLETEMAGQYPEFLTRQEGRANVNRIQGYELQFQFRRDGRLMYGRRILLLPTPTARDGVELLLQAPRDVAIARVDAVGRNGPLKTSLRSFRLGTERP